MQLAPSSERLAYQQAFKLAEIREEISYSYEPPDYREKVEIAWLAAVQREFDEGLLTEQRLGQWVETRIDGLFSLTTNDNSVGVAWIQIHPQEMMQIICDPCAFCRKHPQVTSAYICNPEFSSLGTAERRCILSLDFRSASYRLDAFRDVFTPEEINALLRNELRAELDSDTYVARPHYTLNFFHTDENWQYLSQQDFAEVLGMFVARYPELFLDMFRSLVRKLPKDKLQQLVLTCDPQLIVQSGVLQVGNLHIDQQLCRWFSKIDPRKKVANKIETPEETVAIVDVLYKLLRSECAAQADTFVEEMLTEEKTSAHQLVSYIGLAHSYRTLPVSTRQLLERYLEKEGFAIGRIYRGEHRTNDGQPVQQLEICTGKTILVCSRMPRYVNLEPGFWVVASCRGRVVGKRRGCAVINSTFEFLERG